MTYRETALLIDPKFSSMDSRQRVAIVVAHELAHQWFGNLVVCILISFVHMKITNLSSIIFRLWIGGLIYVSDKNELHLFVIFF